MKKISAVKRVLCALIAVVMVVLCAMSANASQILTYTGDTANNKCVFQLTTNGGKTVWQASLPTGVVRTGTNYSQVRSSYPIGTVVTVDAQDWEQGKFLYWYDSASGRILSFDNELKYVLGTKVNYRANYLPTTVEKYVTYVSYGGSIVKADELSYTEGLSAPPAPSMPGLTFRNWSMTEQQIANSKECSVVYPVYTVNKENYTVNITNTDYVSGAGTYPNFSTVALKAEPVNGSGESFSYWKDSKGNVVSYDNNYNFRINYNETFTAVYGEEVTPVPVIRITKAVPEQSESTVTFFAERWVPENLEVINHGILISVENGMTESKMILGSAGDTSLSPVMKGIGKSNENSGTFSIAKDPIAQNQTATARPYVLYLENGTVKVLYGDIVTATTAG